jgi:septal ring factor EnvC (AmiA/AmiB activator)
MGCRRRLRASLGGAVVLFLVLWARSEAADPSAEAAAHAKAANKPADATAASAQRRRELQGEQRELKNRLAQLKKSLAATESAHSEAADALAVSETAISSANRHLQQLTSARRQVEQRIGELQASQKEVANAQTSHASRLGSAARKEFVLLHPPAMLSLLDPVQLAQDRRDSAYLDWVVRERMHRIGELDDRRTRLAALEAESRQRSQELARIDADERTSRSQLLKQEAVRKSTLARLAREIAGQRQSVANLERDDARLGSVIDQIGRLLAEQARRRANPPARAKTPKPGEPAAAEEPALATPGPERFEPPSATRFARLRGKLVLPVQGPIGSRYGAARLTEEGQAQAGAPAWKGLFIRASAGSPVHAVASGRVVFADWLRGFGNLLILDHGEGFLSVYANNETLLHSVGDQITADEVIASVGNTGGNAQSGLYFEMRYQGRPFDPLSWAVAR